MVDDPAGSRFEVRVGGALGGFAAYRTRPGRLVFTHTEIDPAFEGQGLGSQLVGGALADVRARGLKVTPLCPFVARYIEKHPEHADLVVAPKSGETAQSGGDADAGRDPGQVEGSP